MCEMKEPVIRFKGYTDEWEQRKLGDMVSFSKGTGYSKADLQDSGTPIILYGRLYTKYETVISEVDTFADEKPNSVFSKGGEVIVPASGETAEDISVASVVEQSGVMLGGDLNIITPPQELDSAFLAISISNGKPHSDMAKMAQGKSVVHLHNSDLAKIDLPYPSYEEQRQISHHFKNIDNLIAHYQRKCDDLQEVKKYMLQKMFPRNGEKIPEIRFAGFTDEWEQRKLGDITTKIGSGKTPCGGSEAYVDDGIPLIRSQNVHDDVVDLSDVAYIDEETNKSMENSLVAYNDVLLNITGASIGRSAVYKGAKPANVNQHVCIIRPTEDYSSDFIQMNLASSNGQKQIDSSQAGGAREGLNFQQIGKMEFAFPSVDEQNKIGTYFSNLNNLITLHQCECDALKEVKKFMLQNMFPEG